MNVKAQDRTVRSWAWSVLLAGSMAVGCATGPGSGGSLKVKKIEAVAEAPANVAAYFTVRTKTGEVVSDLDATNFRVFENGKLVSEKKAKRALLDPKPLEAQYTLVLVDVSGPLVDSEDFPDLVTGVGHLVERASRTSQVALSVFDGEDEPVPMLGFGASGTKAALEAMRHFRPRNRNGNMNGAIVQSLDLLEKQLDNATAPFRYGSLVVITDRGDVAHKVNAETLTQRLAATPVTIYLAAVGPQVDRLALEPIARGGLFVSTEPKDFRKGLKDMVERLEIAGGGRYMFSYCSNKREGSHTLTLVVDTADDRGRLVYKFNADGFTNGCAPKHLPVFDKPAKTKE